MTDTSPIRRLAPELLAEIFLHCPIFARTYRDIPSVFVLSQVCTTWRIIAHSTPRLWSNLSLEFPSGVEQAKTDHVSFVKAWLSRARLRPLTVSVGAEYHNSGTPIYSMKMGRIINAIMLSAGHIRHLRLCLPFSQYKDLTDVEPGSMVVLETVNLSLSRGPYNETHSLMGITAFQTAPRLHGVNLFPCPLGFSLYHWGLRLPWSQLSTLFMYDRVHDSLDLLRKCPNLVNCKLRIAVPIDVPDTATIVLPHLRMLTLSVCHGEPSRLFQHLDLPALKCLSITLNNHQPLHHSFISSSRNLERLHLDSVRLSSDRLLPLLTYTQSLVELRITRSGWLDKKLFNGLVYRERDDHQIVPKLKILQLWCELEADGLDADCIASMLDSRWWPDDTPRTVSCLQEVVFNFVGNMTITPRVRRRLQRFYREGLILAVNSRRAHQGCDWVIHVC